MPGLAERPGRLERAVLTALRTLCTLSYVYGLGPQDRNPRTLFDAMHGARPECLEIRVLAIWRRRRSGSHKAQGLLLARTASQNKQIRQALRPCAWVIEALWVRATEMSLKGSFL